MTNAYAIKSRVQFGAHLKSFTQKEIKDEPMLFSCDLAHAFDLGGPITRDFLLTVFGDSLPLDSNGYCFDSRVHMLMPGWFPCIPGWHHDDVPRSRADGQPNYRNPEFHSKHILALHNGDIAPTEFAVGNIVLPHTDGVVYKEWHPRVQRAVDTGQLELYKAPSGQLCHFDCDTFHQGVRAVGRGFRWFGRLSWDAGYEEGRPHANEVRRQVNVYMEFPMEGW